MIYTSIAYRTKNKLLSDKGNYESESAKKKLTEDNKVSYASQGPRQISQELQLGTRI